ncbi:hypothetical protein O181_004446 [Austropuccinia psidii MF-1]|uniref:Uncharacterized protein n=1 Tax=Austropuccinia psidii MF-1 TaxID=1389203 RepID=A0A9Q3BFK2_9BASI|nr:hypothetical protein [Austropuccinia psidii MF-1]
MASSGHFDLAQTYDGYKAVEVLDPSCTKSLAKGKYCFQHSNPRSSWCHFSFVGKKPCHSMGLLASSIRRYLWSKQDGSFDKEFPVSGAPTPYVTGSRKRDVARWTNAGEPIAVGGRDELDGEEGEVAHNSICNQSSTFPSHPPAKRFQIHIIPSTPRTFQPTLATIPTSLPPASPSSSTTRPALIPAVGPSPIPQSRNSPIVTSQQLQPITPSSRKREELSPFPFPAAQVVQQREKWPI